MSTSEQIDKNKYHHKKYRQRKRSRDDIEVQYLTDSDSSETPNLPKQRKITTLTPKQRFKTEKAINELRVGIQKIDLNDPSERLNRSNPETSNTREVSKKNSSSTDSNGNVIGNSLVKRGRSSLSSVKTKNEESLSDEETNEKLVKLDIPLLQHLPSTSKTQRIRRVTFGGFAHQTPPKNSNGGTFKRFPQTPPKLKTAVAFAGFPQTPPKATTPVSFKGFPQTPPKEPELTKTIEVFNHPIKIGAMMPPKEPEKIKFAAKKIGRTKSFREIHLENEWKIYKNMSLTEFAARAAAIAKENM